MASAAVEFMTTMGESVTHMLKGRLVGRRIADVVVGVAHDDEIRATLILEDGLELIGPLVASYDDEAGRFVS